MELLWALNLRVMITCVQLNKFQPQAAAGPALPNQHCDSQAAADASAAVQASPRAVSEEQQVQETEGLVSTLENYALPLPKELPCISSSSPAAAAVDAAADILGANLSRSFYQDVLRRFAKDCDVDEAGEWGEFHTAVLDSPMFQKSLSVSFQKLVDGDYCFLSIRGIEAHSKPVNA